MSSVRFTTLAGAIFLLLMSNAYGQYQRRQIQINDTVAKLNGGRTFYVVIKKTTSTAFLTDTYADVSDMVFSNKKDPNVLLSKVVWPGRTTSLVFEAPDDTTLGIYLLVTNPGGDWKMLLNAPLLHHYNLRLSQDGGQIDESGSDAAPIQMRLTPRPYPIQVVKRPLTLYPEMIQAGAELRYADATDLYGTVDVGFGVASSLEARLTVAGGSYTTEGLDVAPTITPGARLLLTERSAFEMKLPVALNPTRVGLTFGLPTRVYTGNAVLVELGEDLMTFRLYDRSMDPVFPERVDTASAKLRALGRVDLQVTHSVYLGGRTGLTTNAFNYSATTLPVDVRLGFASSRGFDLELGATVDDALADRPVYVFLLGARGRVGGD